MSADEGRGTYAGLKEFGMKRAKVSTGPLRVLIVEDDTLVGLGLKAQLEKAGQAVVGQAANAPEATALFQSEQPDLVLLDIRLDDGDGLDLATELLKQRRCPMIVVSAYSDKELIERAAAAGVFGYLVKPVTEPMLQAQIEIAVRRFREVETLVAEKEKLAHDLETRRLLDRAKAVLIKRAGLTEDEAHRRLQQESQKRRVPLSDLCKKVIDSDEVLGV